MLQERMNEIKVENDTEIVREGYFFLTKTEQEDMPPTFSGQKSRSEVNLFMDKLWVFVHLYVCVFFSAGHLQYHCHY
jgi:hypothetical protein